MEGESRLILTQNFQPFPLLSFGSRRQQFRFLTLSVTFVVLETFPILYSSIRLLQVCLVKGF